MELIEFQWARCLDGYEVIQSRSVSVEGGRMIAVAHQEPGELVSGVIVAKSERFEVFRPTEIPALFRRFADVPASAEGMRAFADKFGLLEGGDREILVRANAVEGMLVQRAAICRAIDLFEAGDSMEVLANFNNEGWGRLRIELRFDPSGGLRLLPPTETYLNQYQRVAYKLTAVLVPASLIQFLWLQFALHAQSDAKLWRCEHCGDPFTVGSGTGRRETAKFCSNACKVAAFRGRHGRRNVNA